jgi:hypothetical protein
MELDIGKKLIKEKKFNKALFFFLNELEKGNKTIRLYFFLGLTYFELNQIHKSIVYYKLALKIDPTSINTILNLANANYVTGNFLSARSLFLKAIKLNKYNPRPYYGLYLIKPQYLTSKHLLDLTQIKKTKINLYESYLIEFLLSKNAKLKGNYQLELNHLYKYHSECFKFRNDFNLQGLFYYNEIISKHYKKINFNNTEYKETDLQNVSPIFIIGLPRSGSTLIESIIVASELNVISLGETAIFNTSIFNQIKNYIYQKNFDSKKYNLTLDVRELQKNINDRYQNYLPNNNRHKVFVDKSLENFFNIEAILKIFPNAKFINSKRNYKDSALAIFQSMLPDLPWTHSLSNILCYIDNYIKIINFYEKKFSNKILSIDLEKLTSKQIFYSKKIFEFCDLPWSPKVLEFYKKKDLTVKTLSNTQLRNQIFEYNKKKYEPYTSLLKDFKKKYDWLNKS